MPVVVALVMLTFAICPASGHSCEEGDVIARDCASAEAWVRAGLREGQSLTVHRCEPHDGRWPGGD